MDDDGLVRAVARRLGVLPTSVTSLGGVVNRVFRVSGEATDWVVRVPVDQHDQDVFPAEAWAIGAAQRAGVETAGFVATGVEDGVPYMVCLYVPPAADEVDRPWSWLGTYARAVAGIDLDGAPAGLYSRFGADLPAAWRAHVDHNLAALQGDDPLLADGAYGRDDVPRLRHAIQALAAQPFSFGLAHGDLAPRNLVSRGRAAPPVLIDWGNVTTGPAPWTDARQVYEWAVCHRTVPWADYEEFARAAGLAGEEATVARMTVLQLLDVARWAADRRPDLYERYVRECRDGLREVLSRVDSAGTPVIES